jgi:hypothetical protein
VKWAKDYALEAMIDRMPQSQRADERAAGS